MERLPYNVLSDEAYIMYLRKSRADSPDESVEEVLAKHETMLQEYAERELGGRIPESCIFREVVSGETIAERPEMNKVLALIENPALKGVLVVEPQRLSRGDLEDCGKVVNAFRYSNTKVLTLQMIYDLNNKMHRKFFEQELMRGNDYLEYTKEILLRGRIAAIQKGSYIGNIPPFGYDKTTDKIGPTLKPNENADAVRLAYELYAYEGKTPLQIARHFDSIGIKPMNSDHWVKSSVASMLKNVHYIGMVRFGYHKTEKSFENGQLVKRRSIPAAPEEVVTAKGRHQAIVPQELFNAVQERLKNNPRAKWNAPLKNIFAGLLFCSLCGKAMARNPYEKAQTRFECRSRNGCASKSVIADEVIDAVIFALKSEQLPMLEARLKNDDGNALVIQQKQLQKMNEELEELKKQEDKQYELLEKGFYTEDKFTERNTALHAEMDALKTRIFDAKKVMPKKIDYADKIVKLKDAINAIKDDSLSVEEKNKLLKKIIKRIDYEYLGYEGKGKVTYRLHIQLLL